MHRGFNVRTVLERKFEIVTAPASVGIVLDGSSGKGAIRDDDNLICKSDYLGREDVDLRDYAVVALSLDVVSGLERLEHQQDNASGKVLESAAEGKAYCHTSSSQKCSKRRSIDS